jgi:hypothetical protein
MLPFIAGLAVGALCATALILILCSLKVSSDADDLSEELYAELSNRKQPS